MILILILDIHLFQLFFHLLKFTFNFYYFKIVLIYIFHPLFNEIHTKFDPISNSIRKFIIANFNKYLVIH